MTELWLRGFFLLSRLNASLEYYRCTSGGWHQHRHCGQLEYETHRVVQEDHGPIERATAEWCKAAARSGSHGDAIMSGPGKGITAGPFACAA